MASKIRVNEITDPTGLGPVQTPYGLKFANNASSDANTLDWYEEGNFTPSIVGFTTAGVATYTTVRGGSFVRIGRVVHIALRVAWSAHTGTGAIKITGLPYSFGTVPNLGGAGQGALFVAASTIAGGLWMHADGVIYVNTASGFTTPTMVSACDILINGQYITT